MVHGRRVIVNAIVCVNRTGCPGGTCPATSWRTVYGYSARWRDDGTLQLLHDG